MTKRKVRDLGQIGLRCLGFEVSEKELSDEGGTKGLMEGKDKMVSWS